MNVIPYIILDKIYWYLWKLKQKDLCQEYHQRIDTYIGNQIEFMSFDDLAYNYRIMNIHTIYDPIYDLNSRKVAILPKNYIYTLKFDK